jgi:hypothetical protein
MVVTSMLSASIRKDGIKMKKTVLKLYEKLAYGRVLICCENETDQKNIHTLTGKKTLSLADVQALEELGVTIEWKKMRSTPCPTK